MKLIVGGAYQGKKEAAVRLTGLSEAEFLDGSVCSLEEIFSCKGLTHFHTYIRRLLEKGDENVADRLAVELLEKNPGIVLVSTELGYGIVPMDPFDRMYREKVGRVCCEIAGYSEEVYRVIAGLPVCIKGETR